MFGFTRFSTQLTVFSFWFLQNCTFGSAVLWFIFALTSGLAVLWALLTYDHDYWVSRGVFSPPAWPLVGHIRTVVMFQEQGGMCFKRIYDKYKHLKFLGVHQFFQRTLVLMEPALVRRVCAADFQHFVDRGFFFNRRVDPLAGSVLFLRGAEWRRLRTKISPIFSPNKLRSMLPIIDDTAKEFANKVGERITEQKSAKGHIAKTVDDENNNPEPPCAVADADRLAGGFTADAIVPCAFGLRSHVMDNEKDPFAVALQAFYETSPYNVLEKTMRQFWPAFALFFRMRIIPKKTHDFFCNIVQSVLRARESGEQEKRGDFIDMMMSLRSADRDTDDQSNNDRRNYGRRDDKPTSDDEDVPITDMVISANAFIIFLGGFETTSSTLAFLLMELAYHQEVQDTLRTEIREVLSRRKGEVTYETLQDLTYMEMVILETLRLYPPFPSIQRICTKEYRIPDTDVVIEKGTIVVFPTLAIQRDDAYFEHGDSFVPERWSPAGAAAQAPPGVYMPFGDGPRYCIGKRFAMVQMKCCLLRLIPRVRVSPPPPEHAAPAAPAPAPAPARTAPHAPDPRSPLTLHPADSKLTFTLL